jgi:hypothetical protein
VGTINDKKAGMTELAIEQIYLNGQVLGAVFKFTDNAPFFKPNKGLVSWAKYSLQVVVLGG